MWVMDKESHRCLTFPEEKGTSVRQGHWIEIHDLLFDYIRCSECGEDWCTEDNDTETFNYCPNCGAEMDESTMGQVKPSDKELTLYADDKPIVTFKDSKIVLHGERKEDAETD